MRKPTFKTTHILLVLLIAVFVFDVLISKPNNPKNTVSVKTDESVIARLGQGGSELKILTNTILTDRNFIFLDPETNVVVTTLSVGNPVIETPSYRIFRGNTHDWFIVTRIYQSGTGYMDRYDVWYRLNSSGIMKDALEYPANGLTVPDDNGKNVYWNSEVTNGSVDDTAIDVTFTTKTCSRNADASDKDCSISTDIGHYDWDPDKEVFIFKK